MTEQEKDAAWVEERLPEDWPWAAECPAPACEVCKAGRLMAEEVEARRAAEDREQVLKEEIEGLRKKLEAEAERPAICAYCNEGVYVNDADGLKRLRKHVEQECPLHPIRKVEAELAEERTAREAQAQVVVEFNAYLDALAARWENRHRPTTPEATLRHLADHYDDRVSSWPGNAQDEHDRAISAHMRSMATQVETERVALQAQLDELQEQHRRIIAEECPTDEKHCGCVPALRGEIGQLQGENERLKAALHQLRHTNYPGCM